MSDPDQIRAEIERTRGEFSSDVDALADKVTPSKIVDRQTEKVRGAFSSVKERVMGTASDAKDSLASAGGSVADAPRGAVEKAKGNPLAVGLIALGAGWLVASLMPPSDAEKRAASNLKDAAQPLVEKAGDAAKEVASNLKEPAQDAAQSLKSTATEAAENIRGEATSAADDVRSQAGDAKNTVQNS